MQNTYVAGCQSNYGRQVQSACLSSHDTVTVASTMVMTLTVQFFPNMSTNHKFQKHTGVTDIQIGVGSRCICIRFFPHWVKALAPEDIDSLTHCRAVRHAPVLRPRSPLDGHLSQLQTHRGFIRAILLLHDSGNQ